MGLLVDATIPLSAIAEMKETTTTRGGLKIGVGARYMPITRQLFVTSGFNNLVSLKLGKEVHVGKLRKRRVEEIILNVSFLRGFLEALESAKSGAREV